jgi:hypothetical protein
VNHPFRCNNPDGKCDLEDTVTVPRSQAPGAGAEPSAVKVLEPEKKE